MKIGILHRSLHTTRGAEKMIIDLCTGLKKRGLDITVITQNIRTNVKNMFSQEGIHFCDIGGSPIGMQYWFSIPKVVKKLQEHVPTDLDVINAHNFPSNLAGYKYIQSQNKPFICYIHEPPRFFYDRNYFREASLSFKLFFGLIRHLYMPSDQKAVKSADLVLANSAFTKAKIEAVYEKNAQVLYPGIDIERFHHRNEGKIYREQLFPNIEAVILTVSRLSPVKNIAMLIKSFKYVYKKLNSCRLVIIGRGQEKNRLVKLSKTLGLDHAILFLTNVPDKEMPIYYSMADIVAYPPLMEPWGLVPIEAMSCETPVVASNEGGPLESVIHEKTGLLSNPRNPIAFSNALLMLLKNEELRHKMGKEGRALSESRFSLEVMIDNFLAAFRSVL
ncbi:glycosyltransferase family 4 protein [Candidatus Borrarchaeum sp.]|uniref:glycosyltransferase family 4 protein n=1 Tax=Candidatus Borrarchaeum sp. TaxID=2846742 RepID=UPI00257BA1DA|nr:glycosyltransferase family 4 protein [Candidatus Borrarchaeum sp.]